MKLPILLYHDLDSLDLDNEKKGSAAHDTVVRVEAFESQLRFLSAAGYQSLSLSDYFDKRATLQGSGEKRIIITFDDGHHSNYYLALPLLKRYGFTATFFVVASWIGEKYHLTEEQIREMSAQGMEIASHGLTHSYLPLLEEEEIVRELKESRRRLSDVTGVNVDAFAYPGGHYDSKVLRALMGTGYRTACSCLQGLNGPQTTPLLLRRLEVRRRYTEQDMSQLFNPSSIAFYQSVDFIKGLLRRTLGLKRYSDLRTKCYGLYRFKR